MTRPIEHTGSVGAAAQLPPALRRATKPFAAPTRFPAAPEREESDNYGAIVAILNPKLRVICSRCDLQWIVQRQNRKRNGAPIWSSFAYCATKEGLLLRLPEHGGGCDPVAWRRVAALPHYFPKRADAEGKAASDAQLLKVSRGDLLFLASCANVKNPAAPYAALRTK